MTKHEEGFRLAGMVFIPMVVETFGGWEESAVLQLKTQEEKYRCRNIGIFLHTEIYENSIIKIN